jgi:predicted metal-dependent hydrolase
LQERSPHFLLGLDLFNGGYPWEAHEVWEQLWGAAGRRGETADFLKVLIKFAAAAVKQREGKPAGVRSHAGRAALLLRPLYAVRRRMWGLDLGQLLAAGEAIARDGWPREEPYLERTE